MKMLFVLDGTTKAGGTPLLMHNERLADPLDDKARAIAKLSRKRSKTDADHREIARLEFLGSLYLNERGPCLPTVNLLRCLQDAAKRTKRGRDVLRGVVPVEQTADLAYDGPRSPEEMWKSGRFALRRAVGIKGSRTMRTRPIFCDWSLAWAAEVDPAVFDPDFLAAIWADAGRYVGIGDGRPIYGRFRGTVTEWPLGEPDGLGEAAYALATAVARRSIEEADLGRLDRHGPVAELVRGAFEKATALQAAAVQVSDGQRGHG